MRRGETEGKTRVRERRRGERGETSEASMEGTLGMCGENRGKKERGGETIAEEQKGEVEQERERR